MKKSKLGVSTLKNIDQLVKWYCPKISEFSTLAENLVNFLGSSEELRKYIHSIKFRVKEPSHFRDKLKRKAFEALKNGKKFRISEANLNVEIPDLIGIRILHLHTEQMAKINQSLIQLFEREKYVIKEGPNAKTWDDEYREIFGKMGISCESSKSMYTSVHYIVAFNNREAIRFELQVRTLFEEIWGEVSHKINYPRETKSISSKEQLKVLARITSGGTRLVDSIFNTEQEHKLRLK